MTTARFCDKCGEPREENKPFCISCGQRFGDTPGGNSPASSSTPVGILSSPPSVAAVPHPVDIVAASPRYAGFGQRCVAYLIDVLVLTVVAFVLARQNPMAMVLLMAIYFIGMWGTTGRTLGMRARGLRITTTDGMPISYARAALRYVALLVAITVLLLGVLLILIDRRRQGLHDKIAGTVVVYA